MADLSGTKLGNYQLISKIGRGGMAEVYKGYHANLDRHVAVKILHGYLADGEDFLARFEREAQSVATLRHDHIVQIYDFDVQDDQYYMVMEYVDGGTLGDWMDANPGIRDVDQILSILQQIACALDYAHSQGIIHRDIKPANILIGQHNNLFLTDFGIARIMSGAQTQFTATGALIGTPAYMSPEQCKGEEIGPTSDVYSLGVILFELLTGQQPYEAETPLSILQKHITEPIPSLGIHRHDLPPVFEEIISKSLAKDPANRYQIAGDLAADLGEAVEGSPKATREILPEKTMDETVVTQPKDAVEDSSVQPTVLMEEEDQETDTLLEVLEPLEETREQVEPEQPTPESGPSELDKKSGKKGAQEKTKKPFPWKIVIPITVVIGVAIVFAAMGGFSTSPESTDCEDPWGCREHAIEAWEIEDFEAAATFYEQAISMVDGPMPEFAPLWCEYAELGWILDRDDRFYIGAMCYMVERGGEVCGNPESCIEWGFRAWEEGALWEAAELLSWAADLTPDDQFNEFAFVWCERAEIFRQLGESDLAHACQATCEQWDNN